MPSLVNWIGSSAIYVFVAVLASSFLFVLVPTNTGYAAPSCSSENNKCLTFCKTKRPFRRCFRDCNVRQNACLTTGTYRWKNRANATGLTKCCGRAPGGTCSAQNKMCKIICRGKSKSCSDACRARQRTCLSTGTYRWKTGEDATQLIRK